jgi:hypothetical protein
MSFLWTPARPASTLIVDDFEDGNIAEYSGATGIYSIVTSPVSNGSRALKAKGASGSKLITSTSGLANYPAAGDTLKLALQLLSNGSGSVGGICFGVQDTNNFYLLNPSSDGTFKLFKKATGSFSGIASTGDNLPGGNFLTVTIDWGSSGTIAIDVVDSNGTTQGSLSVVDTTYSSGGVGFRYSGGSDDTGAVWDFWRIL